jgi:hypothetical protein
MKLTELAFTKAERPMQNDKQKRLSNADITNKVRAAVTAADYDPDTDPVLDFYTRHGHGD